MLQPQLGQAGVEGTQSAVVALVGIPQLGGDEQLIARQTSLGDGLADALLVAVDGRGINVAIAQVEGRLDHLSGLVGRGLPDSQAELRDMVTVVELKTGDRGHASLLWNGWCQRCDWWRWPFAPDQSRRMASGTL